MLWEHDESNKKIKIHQNLFKYWFTLSHFALEDPVGQKSLKNFIGFLIETMTPKGHFEIN